MAFSFQDYSFVSQDIDRRYVHANSIFYQNNKLADGTYETNTKSFPLTKCKLDQMQSDFMRSAYKLYNLKGQYCIDSDNPEIYFYGTKNDVINELDTSWVMVRVAQCSEKTKLPGDPDCASDIEIENYLKGMYIFFNSF